MCSKEYYIFLNELSNPKVHILGVWLCSVYSYQVLNETIFVSKTGLDDKILNNSLILVDIHCMDRKVQVQNCLWIFWFHSILMQVFVLVCEWRDYLQGLKTQPDFISGVDFITVGPILPLSLGRFEGRSDFVSMFVCWCMCACVHLFICSLLLCSPVTGPFGV